MLIRKRSLVAASFVHLESSAQRDWRQWVSYQGARRGIDEKTVAIRRLVWCPPPHPSANGSLDQEKINPIECDTLTFRMPQVVKAIAGLELTASIFITIKSN